VTNANGGATTYADLFMSLHRRRLSHRQLHYLSPSLMAPRRRSRLPVRASLLAQWLPARSRVLTPSARRSSLSQVLRLTSAPVHGSRRVLDTCNTITVPITPVSFSGSTPILDGLVVTNPLGGGSVNGTERHHCEPGPGCDGYVLRADVHLQRRSHHQTHWLRDGHHRLERPTRTTPSWPSPQHRRPLRCS